jgi:hypothetical protein
MLGCLAVNELPGAKTLCQRSERKSALPNKAESAELVFGFVRAPGTIRQFA